MSAKQLFGNPFLYSKTMDTKETLISKSLEPLVSSPNTIRFLLLGDVMLGRLVDKIFPSHCQDAEETHLARRLLQV